MFTDRYFHKRYWTERYFTRSGTAIETCVYVQGSRNRFGTKKKFGTCLKFGDGFSDPWLSIGTDPAVDPFYAREVFDDNAITRHDETLLNVDNRDELAVNFGGVANEEFFLEAPDGGIHRVLIRGTDGFIDVESGSATAEFVQGANFQLALMEEGLYWEPGLPLSASSIGTPEQAQLLWLLPFEITEAGGSVVGTPVRKVVVSLDGELFLLTVTNDGFLEFTDAFQTHDAESAVTPVYTEE